MKKRIEKIRRRIRVFPKRREGQSGEDYARERVFLGLKYGVFVLTAFALLRGILVTAGAGVMANSGGDGRKLPIYCVETPEKKIALSFDAAWGNEDTGKILEILKKHNVRVTFFMTGGWVVGLAYMKKVKYGIKCTVYRGQAIRKREVLQGLQNLFQKKSHFPVDQHQNKKV